MLVTLAAMLGQIGTRAGVWPFLSLCQRRQPHAPRGVLASMAAWRAVPMRWKIPVARIVEALENPGASYQHNGMERRFPDIRFIWWAGGANFTHHQDTNRLIRAWQNRSLSSFPNAGPPRRHADIVLPATTSFERNDMTMTGDYSNQHLVPMKRVVAPRDEARDDFEVFADLSERWKRAGGALYRGKTICSGWRPSIRLPPSAGQQVTLPPFAQFWQANQLIEMPENPECAFRPLCRLPRRSAGQSAENRER
jgi:biotin/methionine sulfoxide reductase